MGVSADGLSCEACDVGQYYHKWSRSCRSCGKNCNECEKWYMCDTCADGFENFRGFCYCTSGEYDSDGACLPESCRDWEYDNGTSCEKCSKMTRQCTECADTTGQCSTCKLPYLINSDDFTCDCPAGFYDTLYDCVQCEAA